MPTVIAIPVLMAALAGLLSFGLLLSILQDLSTIAPDKLDYIYTFESRVAAWIFKINPRRLRAVLKDVPTYGDRRLTVKVQVYRALYVFAAVCAAVALATILVLWLTWVEKHAFFHLPDDQANGVVCDSSGVVLTARALG